MGGGGVGGCVVDGRWVLGSCMNGGGIIVVGGVVVGVALVALGV